MHIKRNYPVLAVVALALVLGGGKCEPDSPPDSDAETPLARGRAERVDGACETGAATDVTELVIDWLGGDAEATSSCGTYKREIATGVTLGQPDVLPSEAHWTGVGGRGDVMADAAVCMLADLRHDPGMVATVTSPSVWTEFGPVSVEQRIGYLDWDPATKRFDGYQNVAVCAPVLGCLDASRQQFHATVRESNPAYPSGVDVGDYPVDASYSVEVTAEESATSFSASLPPITVITPYGPIDVTPELEYATGLYTIDTPFDGGHYAWHEMFGAGFGLVPLDDVYGRASTPLVSSLVGVRGGWASQLGLGGRDGRPDADLWVLDPTAAYPERHDLDLTLARSHRERDAVVHFGAGLSVTYEPLGVLPSAFLSSPFSVEFSITVEPRLDAYYASELELLSREGHRLPIDVGDGATSMSQFYLAHGVTAAAEAHIDITVHLVVDLDVPVVGGNVISIHETIPVDLGGGHETATGHAAVARSTSLPGNAATLAHVETMGDATVDQASFLDACFAQDPPPAPIPPVQHEPGSGDQIAPGLYPCNICARQSTTGSTGTSAGPGVLTLFPYGTPSWTCRPSANGCFDLCRFDATTAAFTAIEKSAPEVVGSWCAVDVPR